MAKYHIRITTPLGTAACREQHAQPRPETVQAGLGSLANRAYFHNSIWCDWGRLFPKHEDEIAAALEHPDRIYEIKLEMAKSTLAKLPAWVEASFLALEILHLDSPHYDPMILPDAFLAPSHGAIPSRLLQIKLTNVYFPNLPQLLLSGRNLVSLSLRFDRAVIPNFFSPEVIATALSAASQLKKFSLYFRDEVEGEQVIVPLPSESPVLLSSLNEFCFDGSGTTWRRLFQGSTRLFLSNSM
jgi:hypothetical protein